MEFFFPNFFHCKEFYKIFSNYYLTIKFRYNFIWLNDDWFEYGPITWCGWSLWRTCITNIWTPFIQRCTQHTVCYEQFTVSRHLCAGIKFVHIQNPTPIRLHAGKRISCNLVGLSIETGVFHVLCVLVKPEYSHFMRILRFILLLAYALLRNCWIKHVDFINRGDAFTTHMYVLYLFEIFHRKNK